MMVHRIVAVVLFVVFSVCLVQKHYQRLQLGYQIGQLEKQKQQLLEQKRKLEVIFAAESHPEVLLRRATLLNIPLVAHKLAARPAGANWDG